MAFFYGTFTVICILQSLMQPTMSSYMSYPRIHFAGKYRVDTNAVNNYNCNYRTDSKLIDDDPNIHNFGSNSFQFFDAKVTRVVAKEDSLQEEHIIDPIIGKTIVNNVDRPFAKLVDLDVDCQMHSTIHGMDFGINGENGLLFYGNWTPAIIAQSMWPHIACFTDEQDCLLTYSPGGESFSAQSTTTLTNVEWASEPSGFLAEFKRAFDDSTRKELVIRITQSAFRYTGDTAELGELVGMIGILGDSDTLNVPGERIMTYTKNIPDGLEDILCTSCKYKGNHSNQGQTWMSSAPFEIDAVDEGKRLVHVDLSSSFVMDINDNIRDIGKLQFGILTTLDTTPKGKKKCVHLIGEEIEYTQYGSDNFYSINGGMYDLEIDHEQVWSKLESNPLVLVQLVDGAGGEQSTEICSHVAISSGQSHSTIILLQEEKYYIRPKGYYVGRFDQTDTSPQVQEVYITKYGQPAKNVIPTVTPVLNPEIQPPPSKPPIPSLPLDGVLAEFKEYNEQTGIAKFEYKSNPHFDIPELRQYGRAMCEKYDGDKRAYLPIDGQVYFFEYGIKNKHSFDPTQTVYLSHSKVKYKRPYTWVKDVGPILSQYAHITPMMKTILDLSSYSDVTKPHNLVIMREAFQLDFNDPSYMPTTRDLSPTKRAMIQEWLEFPLYEDTCEPPEIITKNTAPDIPDMPDIPDIPDDRCETPKLSYIEYPNTKDQRLLSFYMPKNNAKCHKLLPNINTDSETVAELIPERPLLSQIHTKGNNHLQCTKRKIAKQLQTALELEWATIPVYLTSLYSIADGCNVEIYNLIRSVVMQEMLHFALVANMLIALGERPKIDDPDIVPSYPGNLPGCVIPELEVTLEKLSRKHIHDIFMVIELPVETKVAGDMDNEGVFTIGAFYNEIKDCLQYRLDNNKDEIFDNLLLDYQVKWPYWGSLSSVGNLIPILNTSSAIEAINVIVSQGEGADKVSPKDIDDATLAHFFRFEQIYCQQRIKKEDDDSYSYSGYPIHFNEEGISNMRANPTTEDIPLDTICYTESRMFHLAYRNFLRQLQEAFRGKPKPGDGTGDPQKDFFVAVQMMEALQLNAKKLMKIQYNDTDTTCGPVWDYEWKGPM